ncbi:DNA internalization-related competence protein ComEC/Rec2 [Marinobacter salinexigens]|uniref:DNA internalization-related competence protein ComEC/Rec2 n=1 Tax=Marinobacter salinexigens TaxID=2919747 RepID=A0A5B0VLK0_9GAMM|nr:DNA internalization-related competence protein ComEC/Rec2 [Marinobacter salinexigens]
MQGVFAFACGAILLYRLTVLPPWEWFIVAMVAVFLICYALRAALPGCILVCILGLVLGVSWTAWHAGNRLSQQLPSSMEGERLTVSGYLCDIPSVGGFRSVRFSLCVTHWHTPSSGNKNAPNLPRRIRLSWYGTALTDLPGHRMTMEVVLKRPHGTLNGAGFRYEDWLFRQGYRATGTVKAASLNESVPCGIHCTYRKSHAELVLWVQRAFGEARQFPLISSLMVGYRGYLTDTHWDVLKATGTIHLVAISGLHLGLIALGAGFFCRRVLLLIPGRWVSEGRIRVLSFVLVVVSCLVYGLAAGFTVPTQRALVMVTVAGWSLLVAQEQTPWSAWVLALVSVLLLDPFAPLDQGFWLSFVAVSVLIWVFSGRFRQVSWIKGLLIAQLAIFAGLWPVLEGLGQGQPLAGAAANLLAIPWVSFVVMPVVILSGLLVAVFPAAMNVAIPLLDLVLGGLWDALVWVASWPVPEFRLPVPLLAASAVMVLLMVWVPWIRLQLACAGILGVTLVSMWDESGQVNPYVETPEVRIWDVGQGLSVLVRHQRDVLLYDTGPEVPGLFSSVESTVLPELRRLGVKRIDTLVISHGDNDHAGGMEMLVEGVEVGSIVSGEPGVVRERLGHAEAGVTLCKQGMSAKVGRLTTGYWRYKSGIEGNDASCVLSIRDHEFGHEWILPGDITVRSEQAYINDRRRYGDLAIPGKRLVVAPHHGSKTSSSQAWVEDLRPDYVVYSAGYRHRFGHPHKDVVARYREVGATPLNTACSGMITVSAGVNAMIIREIRDSAPFWIKAPGLARDQCKIP